MLKLPQTNDGGSTEPSARGYMVWRNLRDKSLRPRSLRNMSIISKRTDDGSLYFIKKTSGLRHVR